MDFEDAILGFAERLLPSLGPIPPTRSPDGLWILRRDPAGFHREVATLHRGFFDAIQRGFTERLLRVLGGFTERLLPVLGGTWQNKNRSN
jgi:hypothetical protein